jgi:diguanylate cyclase (GGDEF)-like protein
VTPDVRDSSHGAVSIAPFAGAALLAWIAVPVGSTMNWRTYAVSALVLVVSGLLVGVRGSASWKSGLEYLPASITFLIAVAVLRSSAGGFNSGAGGLSLIPVFYTALSGAPRRHLYVVLLAVAAFYLIPIIFIGPPAYPPSQYRAALLSVALASIIGIVTQRLVGRIRQQAQEAGRREHTLEQVGNAVHGLFDSLDPRRDLCDAPLSIIDASVTMLLEPTPSGSLLSTGMAGVTAPPVEIPADSHHPAAQTFRTGRSRLLTEDLAEHLISPDLWRLAGSPGSILFQPLLKDGEVSGVLAVAWPAGISASGSRSTVVTLLAQQAAVAINRFDQMRVLAGMAQTDPLTGLPNRRAWDARVSRGVNEGQQFAVAMLDLDHFKLFNDTRGHPAGDRLLKETAAAWRDQLRTGDLVARLGGEEFGLLLFDCDLQTAAEVTERLRRLVVNDQTCSVGLALRRDDETVDSVIGRADRALYDAKASGRDRICTSV